MVREDAEKMKYFIIFIVLFGAAWSIPPVHAKLRPLFDPIQRALGPVGDKMGRPAKRWAAKNEANVLLRKIAEDFASKKTMPSPSSFQRWVKTNTRGGNKGMDPWGSPYYMLHKAHQVSVGSRGPDKIAQTPDDVVASAPIN